MAVSGITHDVIGRQWCTDTKQARWWQWMATTKVKNRERWIKRTYETNKEQGEEGRGHAGAWRWGRNRGHTVLVPSYVGKPARPLWWGACHNGCLMTLKLAIPVTIQSRFQLRLVLVIKMGYKIESWRQFNGNYDNFRVYHNSHNYRGPLSGV